MNFPTMYYAYGYLGDLDGRMSGLPTLLSAGVAWRNPGDGFSVHVPDGFPLMVDSGGFQAATRWNGAEAGLRGNHGRFPYSPTELHDWAEEISATVVAGMDVACEPMTKLPGRCGIDEGYVWPGDYRDRMIETLDNQIRQRRVYETGDYDHSFMPVVQGNRPDEYAEFLDLMEPEGLLDYDHLAIGTVCKRTDTDEIHEVVKMVRERCPEKHLHLFGATLHIWKEPRFNGLFDSADTAAWNWGSRGKEHAKELIESYQQKVWDARSRMTRDKQLV